MNNRPFFSVVMPTRNRANLLPFAIQSVLNQTFDDFELIVSDNFSTDNIAEIVENFDDKRIKYFRSNKPLSIGDSFTFALSHAKGEYISFLPNDDAFVPIMLERVKDIINKYDVQVVAFPWAVYYLEDDVNFSRNTLTIPRFTGKVTRFDATEAMKLLYQEAGLNDSERNNFFVMPYVSNVVYHHSIFSRLRSVRNDFFNFTPSDMYVAAAVFHMIDHYYCLDEPLSVWSKGKDNVTASAQKKGNKFIEHYQNLLDGYELDRTPLKFALPRNCFVNAVLQAKHDFNNHGDETKVDWAKYYLKIYTNLKDLQLMNIDISQEINEFDDALAKESPQIKFQVKSKIDNFNIRIKNFIKRFETISRILKFFRMLNKKDDEIMPILIRGEIYGINNVLDCSQVIDKEFLNK